ncbi:MULTISPECIES: ANTAR domain-containing protein [unclassified Ensifer]|uniref:ANTAR domain-containing response regulator n=1 Tax=unclassified Ensifer TaxID=2633371 RepID=UPI000812F2F8|nr:MULTISPECIES: ANTAR domain-containing protein [unclassified Ensifer]OCP15983.1 ANTAR domain-containing protein [Ensifer sp. LC384]OCP20052.1 ANTAR domain-containing protein [Ensifer sp. LC54]OCP35482.1 ANTAR domain-containing protein [Ensifer sp. LC163]
MRETPNFAGWRATILHREDSTTERLTRQLKLFGFHVHVQWTPLDADNLPDLILVDADQGWTGLLPWTDERAPRPLVALLGSEAPGRVAWAMGQGASAIIAKPLASSAVYPALVMALAIHRERKAVTERIAHLEERVRMRPLVHAAVQKIGNARKLDEEQAYRILRNCAMQRRLSMEQVAASILGGAEPLPEAG